MTPDQWIQFWAVLFAASVTGFAILAATVAIRGLRDVKVMFRQIDEQHGEHQSSG